MQSHYVSQNGYYSQQQSQQQQAPPLPQIPVIEIKDEFEGNTRVECITIEDNEERLNKNKSKNNGKHVTRQNWLSSPLKTNVLICYFKIYFNLKNTLLNTNNTLVCWMSLLTFVSRFFKVTFTIIKSC